MGSQVQASAVTQNYSDCTTQCRLEEFKNHAIECVLEEYRILWEYYMKLLDERQNIYEYYFRIIGIPITAIGVILGINTSYEFYNVIKVPLSFTLIVIFMVGLSMYITYISESINATKYFKQISNIRKYLSKNLILQDHYDVFGITHVDSRADEKGKDIIKICKSINIPILNSAILVGAIYLSVDVSIVAMIVVYGFILACQIGLYFYIFNKANI